MLRSQPGEHAKALGLSLLLAFASTVICLLLAFPLGLALKDSKLGKKGFMVFVFILPMWMNFLLRTMAWQVLLEKNGIINGMLAGIGLPALNIINTPAAVILGMVYDYLPFMILPIYNALIKIDNNLIEAAYDLGASKSLVLRKVIVPLSVPGIVSGVTMVFCAVCLRLCNLEYAWRRQGKPYRKYYRAGVYCKFQLESGLGTFPCYDDFYRNQHGIYRKI